VIVRLLLDKQGETVPLAYFGDLCGSARSTISEDLALIRDTFSDLGLGVVETVPGPAGGVMFRPLPSEAETQGALQALCLELADPRRILPGNFLYMADIVFSPRWATRIGRIFARRFADPPLPDYVVTVEAKGVPLGLTTAQAFGVPLVVLRRNTGLTEGSAVSINYLTGASGRLQTMSLARRALPEGSRVVIVDDFMKAGGTARGMLDLMAEFNAEVLGLGVLIETMQPADKLVTDYIALLRLGAIDPVRRHIELAPSGPWRPRGPGSREESAAGGIGGRRSPSGGE